MSTQRRSRAKARHLADRTFRTPLQTPDCHDGINFGGPPRWEERSEQSYRGEQHGDEKERERIRGADTIEQTGDNFGEAEREEQTAKHAYSGENDSLAQHHLPDVDGAGSQSHADANFLCALRHRIGHDAVDTDGREDHGQKGEAADGHGACVRGESWLRKRAKWDRGCGLRRGRWRLLR